jgi:DNA (cytosine-5)-methyltransferase 1
MNGISLFAGIGGLDLGLREAAGIRTVCYVEWDGYCQEVLKKRMQEGYLDDAPIWSDIRSFNGKEWAGRVDIVFGGFPCQDISTSGKGAGIKIGTRSGLFYELIRVVGEVRPRFLFLENVSAITSRGIDTVLGCLAEAGYDARWEIVSAAEVGAPHRRERWFCLAYAAGEHERGILREGDSEGEQYEVCSADRLGLRTEPSVNGKGDRKTETMANPELCRYDRCGSESILSSRNEQPSDSQQSGDRRTSQISGSSHDWRIDPADLPRTSESFVGRVAHGVPKRVDRLKCLGNAVVPSQAAEAWRRLTEDLADSELRGCVHRQLEEQSAEGRLPAQRNFGAGRPEEQI